MPRQDLQSFVGEEFDVIGLVTKNGAGYPVGSTAGFQLLFTAKRKKSDPLSTAVLARSLNARTGYSASGVALANGGAYSVRIEDTDTAGVTRTELLYYDVVLIEPDGSRSVVDYGTWKISPGAGA